MLSGIAAICALHELWDAQRYGMLPDVVERYRRWLPERALDPRSVFLVGEVAGASGAEIGGFVVGTVEPNIPIYRVSEFGFIHDLWVEPRFRGRGLATALAAGALRAFGAMGVTQVRLETAAGNADARRVFERLGFRVGTLDMLADLPACTVTRA